MIFLLRSLVLGALIFATGYALIEHMLNPDLPYVEIVRQ